MTDWDRLIEYIEDYFPEPIYTSEDVRDWAQENVPAWQYMNKETQEGIIDDWEHFIEPQVKGWFARMSEKFVSRIRNFLGKLF